MTAGHAAVVAVDVGSLSVKGMAASKGAAQRCIFPTRLAMGRRSVIGESDVHYASVNGDAVRVGDRPAMDGFVAAEIARALSEKEALAALIVGAFSRLGLSACDVLVLHASAPSMVLSPSTVREVLSSATRADNRSVEVGRIGIMASTDALAADLLVDMRGEPAVKAAPPDGTISIVDAGARQWRYSRFELSGSGEETNGAVETEFWVERRAIEMIEQSFTTPVQGVAETMASGISTSGSVERDAAHIIDAARLAAWSEFGAGFAAQALSDKARRVYVGGGNARAFSAGMASYKHIDCRVAKQCETSIVRGLFKSGKRWGRAGL